jgi:hypothetical protein
MSFTDQDKSMVKKIVNKEIEDFFKSTNAQNLVVKIVQKELGTKDIDAKIVDISTKVIVELFKTMWQRKSFWENALKGVK